MAKPEIDDQHHLLGGRVLYTSKESDELYRKANELGLDRIAVRYLGTWPDDMALVFGLDFLRNHVLTIDFPAGRINLA